MELTAKQVAAAFEVSPVTVSSWVQKKRLPGTLPRQARRLGLRFRLSDVRKFAQEAKDEGYSEDQLDRWLKEHKKEVKSTASPGDDRTSVLTSGA